MGPSLSITAVSVASGGGSIVNNGNGTWTYTPAANYNGPVSFNYTASDGSLSASSTASLTLAAVNDAPVATPVTLAAGTEDSAYMITRRTCWPGHRRRRAVAVDHGGERGERRRQHRRQRQRHLDLHPGRDNDDGPVTFNYTVSDGLAERQLDRQPDPGRGATTPAVDGGSRRRWPRAARC